MVAHSSSSVGSLGTARPEPPLPAALAALVRPLDAVRRSLWRLSARTAFGRACLRDRGLRLTTLAITHIAVAATLTLALPVWLLLIGPLVLGVPHVASDVRYLLLSPPIRLGRRGLILLLGPLLAMTAVRVAAALGGPYLAELEILLGGAAMLGGVAIAPATLRKRLLVASGVVALTALSLSFSYGALVVMAYLHNAVAFGLWLWLFRTETSRRALALIALAYGAVIALFAGGLGDTALMDHAITSDIGHFGMSEMALTLAPGLPLEWGLRLVAIFAFMQAIHYVVWLRLIPQRLDERTAPPTIRRSTTRLRRDFGRVGFAALIVLTVAVPVAALAHDAASVRSLYLLAAIAHGWLELAIVCALLTRSRARTAT